jgi:hypothetical protein
MALTRITKGVIKPNENYDTHNIVSTGIVTSVGLDVNGSADISGSLSVGGVLTYEDVTSIDSVGLITARSGIFVSAGSSVGIGTDDLTFPLEIHDSDPRIQLIDTDLTSNRTVQLRNSAGSFVPSASQHAIFYTGGSERVRIKSDGMVGIGTNNPQEELHILESNPSIRIHHNAGTNVFSQLVQNGANLKIRLRNGSSAGGMHIQGNDGTDITHFVRIQSNGNVGIGTNTPAQTLEVSNNSPGLRLTDTNSSAGAGTTSYTQISNINGNTYLYSRANQNNGSFLIGGHGDGVFTERVRILQSGGVGINTTVLPYGQFAVDHGQYGLTRISNHSHLLLQNKNAGSTNFWSIAPRDNARIGIVRGTPDTNGTIHESDEKFTILSDGKTGIGTINPGYGLDVRVENFTKAQFKGKGSQESHIPFYIMSGNSAVQLGIEPLGGQEKIILQASDDSMRFHTASEERIRINNVGHVAIGTDFPNASLPLTIAGQYPGIQFQDNQGTSAFNINADANEFRIQTGHAGNSPIPRLILKSDGRIEVTGDGHRNSNYGIFQVNQAADNDEGGIALLNDANSRSMRIYVDASGNSVINSGDGGGATLKLNEGNGDVIVGHDLLPDADNDQDLGSSSKRWANIYTADLQLSNKGNTNDVDGTWGQYTIQEGEDDLFLINKRNGKKYKFMLEEVN